MMQLIVKGNKFTAAKEAAKRNIPFVFHHEYRTKCSLETVGEVSDQFHDLVAQWFIEANDGAPYPAGTLLHYSF